MLLLQAFLIATLSMRIQCSERQQCSNHTSNNNHSPLLDSLQCYNDYTSHLRCTWEEDPHKNSPILMTTIGSPCIPDHSLQLTNGKVQRSCGYKSVFCWGGSHTFFFNTPLPTEAIRINIAAQGKVLTPLNLTEREINGGDRLLSWSSPYSSSSRLRNLTYQLKYRRHGHDWTVVDQLTNSQWKIKSWAVLPGYLYEAKVRAQGLVGVWSDWSQPVVWMSTKEGIFNLWCVIEENAVVCSWQVKREHAQFLSFHMCWHTNKTSVDCKLCDVHGKLSHSRTAVLDFMCSVYSSEPQLLTVELKSIHKSKSFRDPYNIQPTRPLSVQVKQMDGRWQLSWSRPNVTNVVMLTYQVGIQRNGTQDLKLFNLTDGEFIFDVPPYSLIPSTCYVAQVRAVPSQAYSGRPSDWSEPTYFTNDPASWSNSIIYIFIILFVTVFFILLYNALPACHRRLELWNVSIPSPRNSKVLQEMSTKKSFVGMGNTYSDKDRTSLCFIQTSDKPNMCSILEYPILPFGNDNDINPTVTKTGWLHSSCPFPSHSDGGKVIDKSAVSFAGPYILCRQESSLPSEMSDVSFYSISSIDEERQSISERFMESTPKYEGYVLSASHATFPLEHTSPFDIPASKNSDNSWTEFLHDDPPAYTPSTAGIPSSIFGHPSGYCVMPTMSVN